MVNLRRIRMKPSIKPNLKATDVFCKTPKCCGVLFDVSSRLAQGLGIVELQCREYGRGKNVCGGKWSIPPKGEPR